MALASGSKLGPYEIVAPLGAGGMGEVYRARDTRLDRTAAIKVLPPEVSANPDRRKRFEREARPISSLNAEVKQAISPLPQVDDSGISIFSGICTKSDA